MRLGGDSVIRMVLLGTVAWCCVSVAATPTGTAFTYQGRLVVNVDDVGQPADGQYDLQFRLFDDPDLFVGKQLGSAADIDNVDVVDGYFTVELDFGYGVFNGDARWLQIGVRPSVSSGSFTVLEPRQKLTPAPHAICAAGVTAPLFLSSSGNAGTIEAVNLDRGPGLYAAGGVGVHGSSMSGFGVHGWTSSGYAGYFEGWRSYFSGRVGIGNKNPSYELDVAGVANLKSGGTGIALRVNGAEALWYDDTYFSWGYGGSWNYFADAVGIGTSNPGPYMLWVNGSAAKPGGGSWSNPSDRRLKELRGGFEPGLSEVTQLNPGRYEYREGNALDLPADRQYVGVVAQEVRQVIPEAVEENASGYLMVNNDPIIWAMVNAIKELKAESDSLKQRLEVLEARIRQNGPDSTKEISDAIN